jgi:PAS domain-containing protein
MNLIKNDNEVFIACSEPVFQKGNEKKTQTAAGISAVIDDAGFKSDKAYIKHLAFIVESPDDAIISKLPDKIIRSRNPGAEKTVRYTAKHAVGKPISVPDDCELTTSIKAA